jgi:hypothetical protein
MRSVLLLLFAILVPLIFGTPLFAVYRRKFKALKNQWNDDHPLSTTS